MNPIHLASKFFAFASVLTLQLHAADLTIGSRILVSENNQNFNISVFDGAASADNTGTTITNPALETVTFGEGTVLDFNFFHSPNETVVSYAKGEAGLIGDATSPAENINGSGENWSNVWTTTDPVGFTTTKDFNSGTVPNTFARSANITGTIDISGLNEGVLYIPHGTYINQWELTLTMSGPGQADIAAMDAQTANGPGTNFGWITDFSFADAAAYDTITYTYTNRDADGSRARFMGVILVGVEDPKEMRITNITYRPVSDPEDNILIDLTFDSDEGKTYSIFSSGDFNDPVANRNEVNDSLPAAVGATSTTTTIDFNGANIPLVGRQFFVVKEN
jgi:hypothetical protein